MKAFILIFCVLLISGCKKPIKQYECTPGDSRLCMCLNGELGDQECSKGPLYTNWTPRAWIPCSCCWTVYENDLGPYRIEENDASGCWTDIYDPAAPTYDVGEDTNGDRRSSDGQRGESRNNNKDY